MGRVRAGPAIFGDPEMLGGLMKGVEGVLIWLRAADRLKTRESVSVIQSDLLLVRRQLRNPEEGNFFLGLWGIKKNP